MIKNTIRWKVAICASCMLAISLFIMFDQSLLHAFANTTNGSSEAVTTSDKDNLFDNNARPLDEESISVNNQAVNSSFSELNDDSLVISDSIIGYVNKTSKQFVEGDYMTISNKSDLTYQITNIVLHVYWGYGTLLGVWKLTDDDGIVVFESEVGKEITPENYYIKPGETKRLKLDYDNKIEVTARHLYGTCMYFDITYSSI